MSFATMADGSGLRCAPKRLLISNAVEPTVADALPPERKLSGLSPDASRNPQ
jgi:hypothetical protein